MSRGGNEKKAELGNEREAQKITRGDVGRASKERKNIAASKKASAGAATSFGAMRENSQRVQNRLSKGENRRIFIGSAVWNKDRRTE